MRWHLSWFNYMLPFSNNSIASKRSNSNLLIKELKSLSQAWDVVSSAKLQTPVYLRKKSFEEMLKRRGPKDDLWGDHLLIIFNNLIIQPKNRFFSLTLAQHYLFEK